MIYKVLRYCIEYRTMSNSFQRTFQHLLYLNALLHGPPSLQPAPKLVHTTMPPRLQQHTLPPPPPLQPNFSPTPPLQPNLLLVFNHYRFYLQLL